MQGFPLLGRSCHEVLLGFLCWFERSFTSPLRINPLEDYDRGRQGSLSQENPLWGWSRGLVRDKWLRGSCPQEERGIYQGWLVGDCIENFYRGSSFWGCSCHEGPLVYLCLYERYFSGPLRLCLLEEYVRVRQGSLFRGNNMWVRREIWRRGVF